MTVSVPKTIRRTIFFKTASRIYYKSRRMINYTKLFLHPYDLIIKYKVKNNSMSIKKNPLPHWAIDRNTRTLKLFIEAFEKIRPQIKKDFTLKIFCRDVFNIKKNCLAYCRKQGENNITLIPDFLFINWREVGVPDYDEICNQMMEGAKLPPEYDTLFWIGNVATHRTRKTLCELSKQDKRIEAYGMEWVNNQPTRYVSLPDHTKYKYLIDVQGVGWSARMKILLFSGRPLFIPDRCWEEYWTNDIKPFIHYIPVKEDLSDLIDKLDWAESHPEETLRIAQNAMDYARTHLTHQAAVDFFANYLVENYGNH